MKVLAHTGSPDLATVYIAETSEGKKIEFVESVQPPLPREEKWVLIVSTLYGCPVECKMCDAGANYQGQISRTDIMNQIDYMITQRYPNKIVPAKKFKVQFARMGEPAFNLDVIEVLEDLPQLYQVPGLMPCISTIAPENCDRFFERLLDVKQHIYKNMFQLQFSIHTTDLSLREWLMPVRKWDFNAIRQYGETFYEYGDRKITLNFALAEGIPLDPNELISYFNPEIFLIKITPVNPTYKAMHHKLTSHLKPNVSEYKIVNQLKKEGYEVILSMGELQENQIGSNCGQYITHYQQNNQKLANSYTCIPESFNS
ncbi:radical SAM protein [bacterium]|nr:radical SAM protein [bacterium]